ncbi:uncharacterized protein TRAVEDRAFT_24507 [Trametes versicolor FP-101664 SS1]|uniref:uncharacterized protein n=1 Tax=Trametes versicolor (strain FP-101664) TaxID=717944 RepID=UPI0004621AEA|nr:uncharacterized protein TRAVEDRAFT_24507 [Trametes versicolor FP-101664 SS1]EIW52225.1 hypothetical protein TRAVEDRAFT_24507 [Trametes versicolor FP-101664 SS1]
MRFSLSFVLAMVASVLAADPLVVNTPTSAPQCGDTVGTWTGGTADVHRLHSPFIPQRMNFDGVTEGMTPGPGDNAGTWHTNVPSGTTVFFSVTDATGQTGRSADFVVQPSYNKYYTMASVNFEPVLNN